MSNLTRFASKKTGIAEDKLNFFGALLLSFLPAKTQTAIANANSAARELEAAAKGQSGEITKYDPR